MEGGVSEQKPKESLEVPPLQKNVPNNQDLQESSTRLSLTENEKHMVFQLVKNIMERKSSQLLTVGKTQPMPSDSSVLSENQPSHSYVDAHKLTREEHDYLFVVVKNILQMKKTQRSRLTSIESFALSDQKAGPEPETDKQIVHDNLSTSEIEYVSKLIRAMLDQHKAGSVVPSVKELSPRHSKSIARDASQDDKKLSTYEQQKSAQDVKKLSTYEQQKSSTQIQNRNSFSSNYPTTNYPKPIPCSPEPGQMYRAPQNDSKKPCFTFEQLKRYKQIDLLNACTKDCIECKLQQHLMTQESRYPPTNPYNYPNKDYTNSRGRQQIEISSTPKCRTRNQKCQTNETSAKKCESFTRRESGVQVNFDDPVKVNCNPGDQTQSDQIDKWCDSKMALENIIKSCLKEEITNHLSSLNQRSPQDAAHPTVCLNFPSNMATNDHQNKTNEVSTQQCNPCFKELIQLCMEILANSKPQVNQSVSQVKKSPSQNCSVTFKSQSCCCENVEDECDDAAFSSLPYNSDQCFKPGSSQKFPKYCQDCPQFQDTKPASSCSQNFSRYCQDYQQQDTKPTSARSQNFQKCYQDYQQLQDTKPKSACGQNFQKCYQDYQQLQDIKPANACSQHFQKCYQNYQQLQDTKPTNARSQNFQKCCQDYQQPQDIRPASSCSQKFKPKIVYPTAEKVDREAQTSNYQDDENEKRMGTKSPICKELEEKKINWPAKEDFCQDFKNAQRKFPTDNAQKFVFFSENDRPGNSSCMKCKQQNNQWLRCPPKSDYQQTIQPFKSNQYLPINMGSCAMIAQSRNNFGRPEGQLQDLITNMMNVVPCCTNTCWSY